MSWMFFCIFKVVALPAKLFFWGRKRQNMTSLWRHLRATYHSLWKNFRSQCVKLIPGRVPQVWWRLAQRFWRYIEKSGGGLKKPPPTRARDMVARTEMNANGVLLAIGGCERIFGRGRPMNISHFTQLRRLRSRVVLDSWVMSQIWLDSDSKESSRVESAIKKSRIWVESESSHADGHLSQSWVNSGDCLNLSHWFCWRENANILTQPEALNGTSSYIWPHPPPGQQLLWQN